MEEIWKDIPGYGGVYQISNTGKVKKIKKKLGIVVDEKIRKATYNHGSYQINLIKYGRRKSHFIHQLVAQAFIPNPNGYKYVYHLNGNLSDNNANNLVWTNKHPFRYAKSHRMAKQSIKSFLERVEKFANKSEEYLRNKSLINKLREDAKQLCNLLEK